MPINCPIPVQCLEQEKFADLSYSVMPYFFASHQEIGNLADESIYQIDVTARMRADGLSVAFEVPVTVEFDSFQKTYYLDIVVNNAMVCELKTSNSLIPEHSRQLLNYLHLLDIEHGQLVNMRPSSVQSRFVNSVSSKRNTRRQFSLNTEEWAGETTTLNWIVELLRELGTGLETPLYHQAIVNFLGGDEYSIKELPMMRTSIPLGNQRFYMMDEKSAFRITAFERPKTLYRHNLLRLINCSPIQAIHWINVGLNHVTFITVR